MEKELFFDCECGGKAKFWIIDCVDEENTFNVDSLTQSVFHCDKCGKKYYCGEWEDFCLSEDEL